MEAVATSTKVRPQAGRLGMGRRMGPEMAILVALVLWTIVPVVVLATGRGVFNGGFALDVPDLMQYMGFIRDAGHHVLISNLFDTAPARHLFLDPVFALSGLGWRLGASIQFALLMWVPIALVALALGWSAYARRLLAGSATRITIALLLAFFFVTPALPLASWLHWSPNIQFGTGVIGLELFAGAYAWGGGPSLAIALMPVFLLAVERMLDPGRGAAGRSRRWYAFWAGLSGLLVMWLHPWQGLTLLAILLGLVVWGRFARRYFVLIGPAFLTGAPLLYYFALSRTHSAWMAVSKPNGFAHFGWWLWLGLGPLLLAIPGFRGRELDLQERMLRLWPLAAITVYLALDRTWFYHALASITLPLAILAVKGLSVRRPIPRALAVAAILAVTLPGLIWIAGRLASTQRQHFFTASEARALSFLDRSRVSGPVLAPAMPLGQAVPGFTGRQTYVGHYYWTPQYPRRQWLVDQLFDGRLARTQAASLIRASGVVFLASDCGRGRVDLRPILGPLIRRTWRFGCAVVYQVRS